MLRMYFENSVVEHPFPYLVQNTARNLLGSRGSVFELEHLTNDPAASAPLYRIPLKHLMTICVIPGATMDRYERRTFCQTKNLPPVDSAWPEVNCLSANQCIKKPACRIPA